MDIDSLRAELEKLFELEELVNLSRDLLGFDPEEVGGTAGKGSFVRALTDHCAERDAIEALCDVIVASKADVSPRVAQLRLSGLPSDDELPLGEHFGDFTILRKLGEGTAGISYVARKDDREWRLKVLRREATRDRRGLHRFLTLTRLASAVEHSALPTGLRAGALSDRYHVAHHHEETQPLAARIGRTGPMHVNEARDLLKGILDALSALHERRLTHGNLKLENVLVGRTAEGKPHVLLYDAGGDRLRSLAPANGRIELMSISSPKTVAPEQLRGEIPTARSDIYSFGALLFEVLTGKPLFEGTTAIDAVVAHLTAPPRAASEVAPRGWVSRELDEFVQSLVHKDPTRRPESVEALAKALDGLGRPQAAVEQISEEELVKRIDEVIANPENDDAALALESAAEAGGDPNRIAEALSLAAEQVEATEDDPKVATKKGLLFRAGRLYQEAAKDALAAEGVYAQIVELDATDEAAQTKLEDLRKQLGKWEELVEALLERTEAAEGPEERARVLAQIGKLYTTELDDAEQALVAFTQAFCENPREGAYADEIERLAEGKSEAWGEVLSTCTEASTLDNPPEVKNPLFERMGSWYSENYSRPDLALQCFQAILSADPAHDGALEGLTKLYRKGQQWSELGGVLMRRADATSNPARSRDLKFEAAALLENQMNDVGGARDIYTQILTDDPGHAKANEALGRIFERNQDFAGYVKVLERQAEALRGDEKHKVICRIAEIHEDRLNDDAEAQTRYQSVIEENGDNLDALRGLDRLLSKAGNFKDLLVNLEEQIRLAATPRQRIALWERVSGIHDEEFLDHEKAAHALEEILAIDSAHDSSLTQLARHYRALESWEQLAQLYDRHMALLTDNARLLDLAVARAHVLADRLSATERAIEAFERVLELDPEHAGALESLARLRETAGHEDAALEAIEALAEKAESGEAKAEQFLRAAKLLESRGDRDGAIGRYKLALDAQPSDTNISNALRQAYIARGDVNAAIELIEREIEQTDGDRQKAKLAAEMATLCLEKLQDDERAEKAAKRSLDYDPTNIEALTVLGDRAFEAEQFVEAAAHYEKLAGRADTIQHDEAVRILMHYVDSLARAGSTEKALAPMDTLLRLAPDNVEAVQRVASVTFEHGSPKRALEQYTDLLDRLGEELDTEARAVATYRQGEAARRAGELETAIEKLEDAADLDPSSALPLIALAKSYDAQEKWEKVVDAKTRHLDVAEGDDRVKLLIEVGEIAAQKLDDRNLAAKNLVAALDERPDDRKLLMRLMQLYSEDKDWSKLVDIVLKLADFVDDPKQKAKYLQTAAMVTGREMGDLDQAVDFYERVRELDPDNDKALDESIELLKDKGDFQEAVELLKVKATTASETKDAERMLSAFGELGELYKDKLGRMGHSIDAYEAAQTLDPDNKERNELLADLYASDPEKYLDKAVAAQLAMLQQNPFREASYKLLRRLYTESKRADSAWCLCQALYVMKLSEPDEERFFKRMRSEDPAYAQDSLSDDDWLNHLLHADADPLLTSVFALIEPAVIATRGQSLSELGYDARYAIDASQHPYAMSQTLHYAAGVMGMELPPTFENTNDPGGLSFLHAHTPSIVLGNAALSGDIPPQAAAFIAARHLAYYRPGMYMRHLVPSGTGLKSWLFAAIKMNAPQFPVAADIEGPVKEAAAALEKNLQTQVRDHLARIVSKLIQSGAALDLKQWVQGIDLTADRIGFVLAHDLETAVEIIRASDESSASAGPQARLKELVLFAIGDSYFHLREQLGITVEG